MKLGLCVIASNPQALRAESLGSIAAFVDGIYVVYTHHDEGVRPQGDGDVPWAITSHEVMDDPERHQVYRWVSDFAKARNQAQALAEADGCDAWCWLDTDTHLVGGEAWREAVEEWFEAGESDVLQVRYDYAFNEHGECTRRNATRMVCRSGKTRWHWPVHELPQPFEVGTAVFDTSGLDGDFYLRHTSEHDREGSARRNLWIIENHEERGRRMDGRMWMSKAAALDILGQLEESTEAVRNVLDEPGTSEQLYMARLTAGNNEARLGQHGLALEHFAMAHVAFPDRAAPLLHMARACLDVDDNQRAMIWTRLSEHLHGDAGGSGYDPLWLKIAPIEYQAVVLEREHEFASAAALYDKAAEECGSEVAKASASRCHDLAQRQRQYMAFREVAGWSTCPEGVWESAPDEMATLPEVARARLEGVGVPDREGRHVAIFCGAQAQAWSHRTLGDGLGGSEAAVVYLSEQLALKGWHVTVYALPPAQDVAQVRVVGEGTVTWMPSTSWDPESDPDLFIAWRRPEYASFAPEAGLRWVWLHDVVQGSWRWPNHAIDGILCLTEFHAKPLLADEALAAKVTYTKNGLPDGWGKGIRLKNRATDFLYASSPDRGLDLVLEAWPRIADEVPNAKLVVLHGFHGPYLRAMQKNPHLRELKTRIEKMVEGRDDIEWRGWVSHDEVERVTSECGFWLYPTSWPETSCITAMQAQALGCIPITSRYPDSGVPETCQWDLGPEPGDGRIRDDGAWQERWIESVLSAVRAARGVSDERFQNPIKAGEMLTLGEYRAKMVGWAAESFSWASVAEQWTRLYDESAVPEPADA